MKKNKHFMIINKLLVVKNIKNTDMEFCYHNKKEAEGQSTEATYLGSGPSDLGTRGTGKVGWSSGQ